MSRRDCAVVHGPTGLLCLKSAGHVGAHVSWDNTRMERGRVGALVEWGGDGATVERIALESGQRALDPTEVYPSHTGRATGDFCPECGGMMVWRGTCRMCSVCAWGGSCG